MTNARYSLRQDLIADLSSTVDAVVEPGQRERWQVLEGMLPWMLGGYVTRIEYGVATGELTSLVLDEWKEILRPDELQVQSLSPLVSEFVDEARNTVERFAGDEAAVESLSPPERERLENSLFDVQRRFERRILPLLSDEQIEELRHRAPTVFHFRPGSSVEKQGAMGMF